VQSCSVLNWYCAPFYGELNSPLCLRGWKDCHLSKLILGQSMTAKSFFVGGYKPVLRAHCLGPITSKFMRSSVEDLCKTSVAS
jgi:hypothetical protein